MDSLVFLNAMTAMLVIIDPIGTALIFNALVGDRGFRQRVKIALKAVLISMLLIVVFARYGQSLLAQLGISIEALRIAGGLLLFYSAFHMVSQKLEYK
ncbi:MarC family protein, partial [Oleiphilus sp. HI0079]